MPGPQLEGQHSRGEAECDFPVHPWLNLGLVNGRVLLGGSSRSGPVVVDLSWV
jgi:hypothetical protein